MACFQRYNAALLLALLSILPVCKADTVRAVPAHAEIIAKVFELSSLPLSRAAYCKGLGPVSKEDATIGDFLSIFWEAHLDTCEKNFIAITTVPVYGKKAVEMLKEYGYAPCGGNGSKKNADCREDVWQVDFQICKRCDRENERWCWGIRFLMRQSDRQLIPGSVWCIGAG